MKKKLKYFLIVMEILLLTGGIAMISRPVYHICRWKVKEITGRITWNQFQRSYRRGDTWKSGAPALWLEAPEIGLSTLVIHDATEQNLFNYPCLALNASEDECKEHQRVRVVLGHRDLHFRKLKDIRIGQYLKIELPNTGTQRYRVIDMEILGQEQVMKRVKDPLKGGDWLVLITCYPFKFTGPAPNRFLVWSRRDISLNSL